jgi:hypothetical protein
MTHTEHRDLICIAYKRFVSSYGDVDEIVKIDH